jgi:hypothetical protein
MQLALEVEPCAERMVGPEKDIGVQNRKRKEQIWRGWFDKLYGSFRVYRDRKSRTAQEIATSNAHRRSMRTGVECCGEIRCRREQRY